MGKKPKQKYKTRADGRKSTKRTYKDFGTAHYTGVKYFYGSTDEDIDAAITAFEDSLRYVPEEPKITFEDVADAWWEDKRKVISLNNVRSYKAHYTSCGNSCFRPLTLQ